MVIKSSSRWKSFVAAKLLSSHQHTITVMTEVDPLMAAFEQQHIQIMFNSVDRLGERKKTQHYAATWCWCRMYVSSISSNHCLWWTTKLGILLRWSDLYGTLAQPVWRERERCDFFNPFILKLTELQRRNMCVDLAGICRLTNHSWPVLTSLESVLRCILHFFIHWNAGFCPSGQLWRQRHWLLLLENINHFVWGGRTRQWKTGMVSIKWKTV